MFLHTGRNKVIDGNKIVMIIDARRIGSKSNDKLFSRKKKKTKSLILLKDNNLLLSEISALTLTKRLSERTVKDARKERVHCG